MFGIVNLLNHLAHESFLTVFLEIDEVGLSCLSIINYY